MTAVMAHSLTRPRDQRLACWISICPPNNMPTYSRVTDTATPNVTTPGGLASMAAQGRSVGGSAEPLLLWDTRSHNEGCTPNSHHVSRFSICGEALGATGSPGATEGGVPSVRSRAVVLRGLDGSIPDQTSPIIRDTLRAPEVLFCPRIPGDLHLPDRSAPPPAQQTRDRTSRTMQLPPAPAGGLFLRR